MSFNIQKGINVSHWLSQVIPGESDNTSDYFTEEDIRFIRAAGFDHIRLPIDEIEMWTETGTRVEPKFVFLKNCIDWCLKHDLRVIVDLHTVRSHHFNAANHGKQNTLFNSPESQEKYLALWDDLSNFFGSYSNDQLAYELLNEVIAEDPEDWNRLLAKAIQAIRTKESSRVIVVGSNMWQQPGTMSQLTVPKDDPNLILSFHFYSPFLVTHYQASWTPLKDYKGSVQYPGIPYNDELAVDAPERLRQFVSSGNHAYHKPDMAQEILPAIEKAKRTGLRLYCGEFGCLKTVPRDQLIQWYRDIQDTFEKLDIAYAAWDYQGNYGIVDEPSNRVDWELLDILTGE